MRHTIWVLLLLVEAACQAGGSSQGARSTGPSGQIGMTSQSQSLSGQDYLAVLDGNTIYPITGTIHVRLKPFAEARMSHSMILDAAAVEGKQSSHIVETSAGRVTAQAAGDGIVLTMITDRADSSVPGSKDSSMVGVSLLYTLDPYGGVRSVSASGSGTDPNDPVIKKALATTAAQVPTVNPLPAEGFSQDQHILEGSSEAQTMPSASGIGVVRGSSLYHTRPVVVVSVRGDMMKDPGSTVKTGSTGGFYFVDEATGMQIYSSLNSDFILETGGQTLNVTGHSLDTIDF